MLSKHSITKLDPTLLSPINIFTVDVVLLVFNGDRLGKLTTVQVALRGNQGHLSRGIVGMPDWGILHDLADRHQEALSPATGALLTPGGHFSPLGTSHRPGPGSVSPWVSDSRYHLLQGLH